MLCRDCLRHKNGHTLFRIATIAQRHSSLTPESRKAQLIIHDTPRSTRIPKKAKANSLLREGNSRELIQRPVLSGITALFDTTTVNGGHEDVILELERMKSLYHDKTISSIQYDKISSATIQAFSLDQLVKYLEFSHVPVIGTRTKKRVVEKVLTKVFKLRIRTSVKTAEHITYIKKYSHQQLSLLLANNGKFLRSCATDLKISLSIEKAERVISFPRPPGKAVVLVEEILDEYLSKMSERLIEVDPDRIWRFRESICQHSGTFLERISPNNCKISWVAQDPFRPDDEYFQALRLMHSCLQLSTHSIPRTSCRSDEAVKVDPTSMPGMSYAERDLPWGRAIVRPPGVTLPKYWLQSTNPKPLYSTQINARPRRHAFDVHEKFSHGMSLPEILKDYTREDAKIEIIFGWSLAAEPWHTFAANVPGQSGVVAKLSPVDDTVENAIILHFRKSEIPPSFPCNEVLKIKVTLDSEGDFANYSASVVTTRQDTLALPQHSVDLQVRSTKAVPVTDMLAIENYLQACKFGHKSVKFELPPTINDSWWLQHFAIEDQISFALSDHPEGRVEWTKSRGGGLTGNKQELKFVSKSTKSLISATSEFLAHFDRQ